MRALPMAILAASLLPAQAAAQLLTGAGAGGAPQVSVFDGAAGIQFRDFFAFPGSFAGGVRVAAGDVNGDLFADILVGAGPGAAPRVAIFDGASLAPIHAFDVHPPTFTGGVYVAGIGGAAARLVPEPTTAALLTLGGLALAVGGAATSRRRAGAGTGSAG